MKMHYLDRIADRHLSYLYDSPEERIARERPTPEQIRRDEYDGSRDWNFDTFGNPKGQTERDIRG